jgi:hypothetical protein
MLLEIFWSWQSLFQKSKKIFSRNVRPLIIEESIDSLLSAFDERRIVDVHNDASFIIEQVFGIFCFAFTH